MTEELKQGQEGAVSPEPAGQGQSADTGGLPNEVWRDHREYESLKKTLADKGYDINELRASVGQLPSKADIAAWQAQQEAQHTPDTPSDLDEYVSKREITELVQRAAKAEQRADQALRELGEMKNLTTAERLDREAQATGLVPTLQKAYKALRQQNPDVDPVTLKSELIAAQEQIVQSRIQQAKNKQTTPSPTMEPQNPTVEPEGGFEGNAREQMGQWREKVKSGILSTLQGSGQT